MTRNDEFMKWWKQAEIFDSSIDSCEEAFEAGQKSMSLEGDEHIIWMHGYNKGKKEAEKRVAERCIEIIEQRILAIDIPAECIKTIKKEFLDE